MDSLQEYNKMQLHRLIFLVDAVMSVLLTLLVLELGVPVLENVRSSKEMLQKFYEMGPHFLSFLLTFTIVAMGWLSYNVFYSLIAKYDNILGILVVAKLLFLCLMPLAASLIGNYFTNPLSFIFLGLITFFIALTQTTISLYVLKKNLLSELVDKEKFKGGFKFGWMFPLMGLGIAFTAYINTTLSFCLFAASMVLSVISLKNLRMTKMNDESANQ